MARAYSNDLRRKFLQAYEKGKGTLQELAERFEVSVGWAKKISATRTRTGQIELPPWRRGPESRVTPAVENWLREQIAATAGSHADGVAAATAERGACS